MEYCCQRDLDLSILEKDKQISHELRDEENKRSNEIRLLLLGAGESGKSTVMKQLKILHAGGFGEEEKKTWASGIHSNIFESAQALIEAASKFGLCISPELNDVVNEVRITKPKISPELGKKISCLWKDKAILEAFKRSSEFQLPDSAEYYLDNVERIVAPGYEPSPEDLLRVRIPTTGIKETRLEIDSQSFVVVDVGGQRSERKKWIHCFENVNAVLYCVSLSSFDQSLFEDKQTNRIQEDLKLFGEVCQSKWFTETGMVLLLNKEDLFRKKLDSGKTIQCVFGEYEGGNDFESSVKFLEERFRQCGNRSVHVHVMTATDTENVRKTFNELREYLLREFGMKSPRLGL